MDLLTFVFFIAGALVIGIWIDRAQNSFLRAHASAPRERSRATT